MAQYANYIIYGVIIIVIISIIVSIVKKAFKFLLFIIGILVLFSAYNIFIKGVSPIDEINGYKTDAVYTQTVMKYTTKIKDSTYKIKDNITSKKVDSNLIKTENANLHKYEDEVKKLKHTSRFNYFHNNYVTYVDGIVKSTDGAAAISKTANSVDLASLNNYANKMNSYVDNLANLKIK